MQLQDHSRTWFDQTHGKKEQGQFELEVATKAHPYYSQYFNIDYSLPKAGVSFFHSLTSGKITRFI